MFFITLLLFIHLKEIKIYQLFYHNDIHLLQLIPNFCSKNEINFKKLNKHSVIYNIQLIILITVQYNK